MDMPTNGPKPVDPEVLERAARRRFTPQYKLKILREAGALAVMSAKKRGRRANRSAQEKELERLRHKARPGGADHRSPKKTLRGPGRVAGTPRERAPHMTAVAELREAVGVKAACAALALPRSTYYRAMHPVPSQPRRPRAPSPRALATEERAAVLEVLHSERFLDCAPVNAEVIFPKSGEVKFPTLNWRWSDGFKRWSPRLTS